MTHAKKSTQANSQKPSPSDEEAVSSPIDLEAIQRILKEELPCLRDKYGVASIGIFGSYIRDEAREDSDLDLLIEWQDSAQPDLFDVVRLTDYLNDLLGVDIDIALKRNLRRRIGRQIMREVVYV